MTRGNIPLKSSYMSSKQTRPPQNKTMNVTPQIIFHSTKYSILAILGAGILATILPIFWGFSDAGFLGLLLIFGLIFSVLASPKRNLVSVYKQVNPVAAALIFIFSFLGRCVFASRESVYEYLISSFSAFIFFLSIHCCRKWIWGKLTPKSG